MLTALDPLRQLNFASLLFRLALAMFFGGMIGMERERKRRPAGFRTYMLSAWARLWRALSVSITSSC